MSSESGATLIMIIVGMVVIAVLGVGVYTLSMTSALNQAEAQKAAKAYYISESCVRIAASEYKAAATSTAKNSKLVSLHDNDITDTTYTFTMPNNQGSCSVEIYPYWFYAPTTTTYPIGATSINLYLPGAVPPTEQDGTIAIALPTTINGSLKKKSGEVYTFSSVAFGTFNADNGGTPVTFYTTLTSALTIAAGDEFYFGYTYALPATPPLPLTLNAGDSLILNTDTNDLTAKIFPPEKGSIFFDQSGIVQLRYEKRNVDINAHTVTLTNIQVLGTTTLPITINSNPTIYMGKSLGFRSAANYGN